MTWNAQRGRIEAHLSKVLLQDPTPISFRAGNLTYQKIKNVPVSASQFRRLLGNRGEPHSKLRGMFKFMHVMSPKNDLAPDISRQNESAANILIRLHALVRQYTSYLAYFYTCTFSDTHVVAL